MSHEWSTGGIQSSCGTKCGFRSSRLNHTTITWNQSSFEWNRCILDKVVEGGPRWESTQTLSSLWDTRGLVWDQRQDEKRMYRKSFQPRGWIKVWRRDLQDGVDVIFSKHRERQQRTNKLCLWMLQQEISSWVLRVCVVIGLFCCIWLPSPLWYVHVDKVLADNTFGEKLLYYYAFIAPYTAVCTMIDDRFGIYPPTEWREHVNPTLVCGNDGFNICSGFRSGKPSFTQPWFILVFPFPQWCALKSRGRKAPRGWADFSAATNQPWHD